MNITNKTDATRLSMLANILRDIAGSTTEKQRQRLAEALTTLGSITTFEAMRYMDIYDPRARVYEMRRELGWEIATVMETGITEAGEKHLIGRYVLVDLPPAISPVAA